MLVPALVLGAACSRPQSVPWTRVHGDANGRHWVEATVPESMRPGALDDPWTTTPPRRMPIPDFLSESTQPVLLFGDVQGDQTQELVLASPYGFSVHDLSGREYVRVPADSFERIPYGLIDVDADGKLDIIMGSRLAPRPTVSAFGGTGAESFRYTVSPAEHAYSTLAVGADDGQSLWLVAREYWPTDARGLIRLRLTPELDADTFYIPPSPLGVSVLADSELPNEGLSNENPTDSQLRRLVIPSLITRHNGQFRSLGTLDNVVSGVDANVFLLRADEEARLDGATMLDVPAMGESRIARFYPAGKNDSADDPILLVLDKMLQGSPRAGLPEVEYAPSPTWLYFLNARDGTIAAELELGAGVLLDFRILPHGRSDAETQPAIVTLENEAGTLVLCIRDRRFRPLITRVIEGERMALGPVVVGDGQTAFFALVDDELRLYTLRLRSRTVVSDLPAIAGSTDPSVLRREPITNVEAAARSPLAMIYSPGAEVIRVIVRGDREVLVWEIDQN